MPLSDVEKNKLKDSILKSFYKILHNDDDDHYYYPDYVLGDLDTSQLRVEHFIFCQKLFAPSNWDIDRNNGIIRGYEKVLDALIDYEVDNKKQFCLCLMHAINIMQSCITNGTDNASDVRESSEYLIDFIYYVSNYLY